MNEKLDDKDYSRQHDITIGEVKACTIFAHLTDNEAEEVIATLKQFAVIAYNFYKKQKENALNAP